MEGQIVPAVVAVRECVGAGKRAQFHHLFLAAEGDVEEAEVPVVVGALGLPHGMLVEPRREQRHRLA